MDKREKAFRAGRENMPHIAIFGRTNAGKSTIFNLLVGDGSALVSPEAGTTTDPVRKSCEILDLGPVVIIDTPGFDDSTVLSDARNRKVSEIICQIDLAVLVYEEKGEIENKIYALMSESEVPVLSIKNLRPGVGSSDKSEKDENSLGRTDLSIKISDDKEYERHKIFEAIKRHLPIKAVERTSLFGDMIGQGDYVLLVCPIDSEAPAGRLILPQVQAIRELLDKHSIPVVVQPEQIPDVLAKFGEPKLAVTDSQIFPEARKLLPENIELTSFSILLAGAKGDMELYKKGLEKIDRLYDGDRILIAENCTHQTSCEDIGRYKIPQWLEQYTGKKLRFEFVSGLNPLPDDLCEFALMIQCGGCMVTASQLRNRIRKASATGVPVTNYGMLIRKIR